MIIVLYLSQTATEQYINKRDIALKACTVE